MMRMRVQMTELLYNIIPNSAPYEGSVITDFTVVLNYVFVVTSGSFHWNYWPTFQHIIDSDMEFSSEGDMSTTQL